MHDIYAFAEELIVYLEVPHTAFSDSTESVFTSTTSFHGDDSDEEKLKIFRSRCIEKKAFTGPGSQAGMDHAFDIFCFLRLLAEEPDSTLLPAFDSSSRHFID